MHKQIEKQFLILQIRIQVQGNTLQGMVWLFNYKKLFWENIIIHSFQIVEEKFLNLSNLINQAQVHTSP